MSEQLPRQEVAGEAVRYVPTDTAYLLALGGFEVPDCDRRDIVVGIAERMGIYAPGEGGDRRAPSPGKVADSLRLTRTSLVDLHTAAEIQGGYKSTGAKVAKHTARAVGVVTTVVELPFELAGNALRGRGVAGSAVGAMARGVSNAFGLVGLAANGAADHSRNDLINASQGYIRYHHGGYAYSPPQQASWLWGSLVGRISKIKGSPEFSPVLDAALARVAVKFMDSYEASPVRDPHVVGLYRQIAGFRPTFDKLTILLDARVPLSGNASKARELLAAKVRKAARSF